MPGTQLRWVRSLEKGELRLPLFFLLEVLFRFRGKTLSPCPGTTKRQDRQRERNRILGTK